MSVIPEYEILTAIRVGVAAISADTTLLNEILANIPADQRATARERWASNPPDVRYGFATTDGPFPMFGVVIGSDQPKQEMLDDGTLWDPDEEEDVAQSLVEASVHILCYATNRDETAWLYRALRRILNAARPRFRTKGFTPFVLSGADLMPEQRLAPHDIWGRRVSMTFTYQEDWPVGDSLWQALNGDVDERFIGDTVNVFHEDVPGTVHPVEDL